MEGNVGSLMVPLFWCKRESEIELRLGSFL